MRSGLLWTKKFVATQRTALLWILIARIVRSSTYARDPNHSELVYYSIRSFH